MVGLAFAIDPAAFETFKYWNAIVANNRLFSFSSIRNMPIEYTFLIICSIVSWMKKRFNPESVKYLNIANEAINTGSNGKLIIILLNRIR